jgi:hypothetical protein
MVGLVPIPGNGNLNYPSYGPGTPVPTPAGGFTTNPDPRQHSTSVFYQPPLGISPISASVDDGFIYGDGSTAFDGFKVLNPQVYSPIITGVLNQGDALGDQINMMAAWMQGVPGSVDPSGLWLQNRYFAPAPNTMMAPQMGMGWPQGQPQVGMPIQRQFNQPM